MNKKKARRFRDDVFFYQISPWTSPSARRISTSTEESHPLNSIALLATILNDVFTFGMGGGKTSDKLAVIHVSNAFRVPW